ncbi:helix-turn-helix domain-containing protein [Phytohabitans sp. ZYX-F-186]|uniref:Helix-turn-helix domain-containing protein n=1 Tax=Phytohabitans maris TaxID=3071409 RepID=A0ABU0ZU28_9ACTN|nr:helix-turn-helix domain-containing protein [Phytohabitans sp. ZYX-F-186]MDQ7910548.1 helix-turn-helix domain-containing protein [Phytohabitans sp. ZYX-F-186]
MSAEDRRVAVLRAAREEFGLSGLNGASTEAIARRVGVSQPYLFRLFPTKKAIFLASINHCFDFVESLFEETAAGLTGEEALKEMGRAYKSLLGDKATLQMQLQMWAAACHDDEIRQLARDRVSRLWRQVVRLSGADDHRVMQFLGAGMLLNVMAAMDLPGIDEQLGEALTGLAEPPA